MKPRHRRSALLAAFATAIALMALTQWLNIYNVRQMRSAEAWVDHTLKVRLELRQQYSALQELESSARWHVLGGEEAALSKFNSARRALARHVASLCGLIVDNPVQVTHCNELNELVTRRAAAAQELVDLSRSVGLEAARERDVGGPGPALMDRIRQLVATMDAEEGRLLAIRTQAVTQQSEDASQLAAWTAVLSAALLAVVFALISVEGRRRKRAQLQRDRFFDLSLDLLSIIDADGRFRHVSGASTRLLGRAPAELLGQPLLQYVHPDDRDRVIAHAESLQHSNATTEVELRFRHAETGWVWLSWKAQRFADDRLVYATARDITQSRATLDALRSREDNLSVTLQSIGDGILTTDADANVARMNRTAERMTGWSQAQALGRPVGEVMTVVDQTSQQPVEIPLERAMKSGSTINLGNHSVLISRTGARCSVAQVASPLRNGSDEIVGGVLVVRDVTDASRLSQALRASEAYNRSIVESSPDWLSLLEPDGRMTILTREGRRLMEVGDEQDASGIDWLALWSEADRPAARAALEAALGGERSTFHGCGRTLQGTTRWWDVVVVPVVDGGPPSQLLAAARDVSARRQLDQAVRDANAFLESVIDNIPSMIFIKRADSLRFERINRAGEALLGYPREALIGNGDSDFFPPEQAEFFRQMDLEVLRGGADAIEISEEPMTRSDGSVRLLHTKKLVLRDEDGQPRHLLGISEDVTEQRGAEAEIRSLNQALVVNAQVLERARADAQAANEAKSAFLATMSHEIRTPMNGVIGMLDVLHQASLDASQLEMVGLIQESAVALLSIIEDVLDFSKIEAGRLQLEHEPLSLEETVEKSCQLLDGLAQKQAVELTMFCDPAIPAEVLGDSLRLRQILINLVNNAIKFCGDGQQGRVEVRALLTERAEQSVTVEIRVRDNGIGMEPSTRSRLFQPFTQGDVSTTRRFGGTGLGLAISSHLIALMGGTIEVESEPGQGSVFSVRLPFKLPEHQPEPGRDGVDISALRCCVVGSSSFADDVASWLHHAGANVERLPDLDAAVGHAQQAGAARIVYVVDHAGPPLRADALRAVATASPALDARFVAIGRGRRRTPIEFAEGKVGIDADLLDRRTLLRSVALAASIASDAPPAAPGDRSAAPPVPSRSDARAQGRLCLVAEDNETNRKVIVRQLALFGVHADVAENGAQALELWRSGDYSLLLTDLHMPLMDGYELATTIRAEERPPQRMPIVALSANALREEAGRCRALGMDDYLSKPARLEDLEAVLGRWLPDLPRPAEGSALPAPLPRQPAPPVRLEVLAELVGDDQEVVDELVRQFRSDSAATMDELRQAVDAGDLAGARAAAHRLRSAANALGAQQLGRCCERLEVDARAGRVEAVRGQAQEMIAAHAAVEAWLATRPPHAG